MFFCFQECSWLQTLFQVVSDNIYESTYFSVSCEEVCLWILNTVMSMSGSLLPIDHLVLSVKDLFHYANSEAFYGKIGNAPEIIEISESIAGKLIFTYVSLENSEWLLILVCDSA